MCGGGGHLLDGMEEGVCPNVEVWHLWKRGCPYVESKGHPLVEM